jgi:hypothetical protein
MPRLLSFPFRLDGSGSMASVDQGSDTEIEEKIAIGMLTRPGERITVPTFGVNDPSFNGFMLPALTRHCLDFGPDVNIRTVSINRLTEGREQVVIDWERSDGFLEVPPQ